MLFGRLGQLFVKGGERALQFCSQPEVGGVVGAELVALGEGESVFGPHAEQFYVHGVQCVKARCDGFSKIRPLLFQGHAGDFKKFVNPEDSPGFRAKLRLAWNLL